jgi:hypothetical protein
MRVHQEAITGKVLFQKKKARSMLFSKNLRKLALGLIVATAASMGFAGPASAELIFSFSQTTNVNPAGGFTAGQFKVNTSGVPVNLYLTGTDFPVELPYNLGSLTLSSTSTNQTAFPVMPLTFDSFKLTSAFNGGGATILEGLKVGSATLTSLGGGSVRFEGTAASSIDTSIRAAGVTGVMFDITFINANKTIPTNGAFPDFTAFTAVGTVSTVPEPSSLALLALGGLGLGVRAYRRRAIVA